VNIVKNIFFWLVLIIVLALVYDMFNTKNQTYSQLAFSDFLSEVDSGQIRDVNIQGRNIEGHYADGSTFKTYSPGYPELVDKLSKQGVRINAAPIDNSMNSFWGVLLGWLPILLLIGVWIFFMRQMQGGGKGGGGAMGFGRSKAKMMNENSKKVTFDDVAGVDEAKEELGEIIDFLKDPAKFQKLGGKIPTGCLLVGSPGTGKTLLARAVAGEANVPFFSISGSEFVEMFVGVGASRGRDMFEQGKKNAPCIIFIDEIDAVGRHRGTGMGGGNDEREQTLNQLLVEMDGFETNDGVIILSATNRPDVLDPALLRPGRFDRQVVVSAPDIIGRESILKVHMSKVPLAPDVDANTIARGTPGFSGADLANLVNEAALLAARRNKKVVTMRELEEAKDKVMMGTERKSMIMSDEEKSLTAYHEGGHAIVALHCKNSDPIHKATIIPRGRALGMVMRLPEEDRYSVTRAKLKDDIAVSMGGRVAEEQIFGYDKVTSGASSDIKYATDMARNMVSQWGMSDEVGPIFHGGGEQEMFLGRSIQQSNAISEETANLIDQEVKNIVEEGYKRAQKILKTHSKDLHTLAKGLLEFETLSGDEINDLLSGKKISKPGLSSKKKAKAKKSTLPKTKKKISDKDKD
jgi:cell division protease FtsH